MHTIPTPSRIVRLGSRGLLGAALLPLIMAASVTQAASHSTPVATPATAAAPVPASTTAPQAASKAEAEVRRVEVATGRIQLRHGPIPNLDMPPMTMVFRVKSPALLEGLKEGDKILFTAEKIDGAYTVTSVEKRP